MACVFKHGRSGDSLVREEVLNMKRFFIVAALAGAARIFLHSAEPVKLIAHRGGIVDERYAENSASSLEAAIKRGYWMAEVDIRETKDGHLVVQHDPDFKRFYGVNRKVADMTWSETSLLRATPGGGRPLEFHELAALARGRIQLMIDTKEPSHPERFYSEMEKALRENGLLDGAFFIGTEESQNRFKGKSRIGVDRRSLQKALDNREAVSRLYYLFEHGRTLDKEGLDLAARTGVPAVVSINTFHYADMDHWKGAEADTRRLRKLGMIYFQIDSVYDKWLLP
jgi:glycerophosphoryl diester phosphodiesterase